MKREYKVALIVFGGSMLVLGAFLWVPLYLAGPDGLERTLFDLTRNEEYEPVTSVDYSGAPFPDYTLQIGDNIYIQAWLVGLIGAVIVCVVMFGLFKLFKVKTKSETEPQISPQM
jgi:hypothetical protein